MLKQIYFVITRRCNLFCSHCIRSSGPDIKDNLLRDQFKGAVRLLRSMSSHECNFLITGGEPVLHSEFAELVDITYSYFDFVVINTNGLYQNKLLSIAKQYPKLKFQISIDGDQLHHEKIRGKKTFDRSLETAHKIAELGNQVTIATTAGKTNIGSLKNLDLYLCNINYFRWTIKYEVIYGRATTKNMIPLNDWNSFVDNVYNKFYNKGKVKINKIFSNEIFTNNTNISVDKRAMNCGTFNSKLYVNPDLTVFPCACLEEISLGDLKKDTSMDIEEKMKLYQQKTKLKESTICNSCPIKKACNGGCPGASLHVHGDFGMGDPRCPAVQSIKFN
jgi:radical SAM protein with 4Fe4S-binding SPASM domain